MGINANGGAAANAGFAASLTNQQQVGQFGDAASAWGGDMMSTIMNDVFGSAPGQSTADGLTNSNGQAGGSNSNLFMQMAFQLGELFAELEQLANQSGLGQGNGSGGSGNSPATPEQLYNSASGNSVGDPHQSFSGTTSASGPAQTGHTDNMSSQSDLIDSNDSFTGGYQVATDTTTPDSKGVTYNSSATVSTNDGYAQVKMGQDGQVSVWDQGQYLDLAKGQTLTLSSGAKVSENAAGDVTVADDNGTGNISTTLSWNGKGVDVSFTANHVALGGYDASLGASQVQPLVG